MAESMTTCECSGCGTLHPCRTCGCDEKITIKEIIIHRAEGPSALCIKRTFTSVADANKFLRTAPELPKLGYDKHDFWITWQDGETYKGRLDVKHPSCDNADNDVGKHVLDWLTYLYQHDENQEAIQFLITHSLE